MKMTGKYRVPNNRVKVITEDYKKKLSIKNPKLEVLDEYINASTSILHKYIECGHTAMITPTYALGGKCSCKECRYKKLSKKKTKTTEQYIEELSHISSHIQVKENYKGANIKISHYCTIHNIEWLAYPSNMLKGCGCKLCGKEKTSDKLSMSNEDYINKLSKYNPSIIPMEKYNGFDTKINHKCLTCGHIWKVSPNSVLGQSTGCPSCNWNKLSQERAFTKEEYINILNIKNPNIELFGTYINTMTKTAHKCKICNHIWDAYPGNILRGHGCPKCSAKLTSIRMSKTHKEFMNDFKIKNPSSNHIEILSQYTGSKHRISCKCLICTSVWNPYATDLLSGAGCPVCNSSLGERTIAKILNNNNINYEVQKPFNGLIGIGNGLLSYDFYLTDYNLLIEFQGGQHERPVEYFGGKEQFKVQQEHDRRKKEYAKLHKIKLLEIWYYDIDNIEEILLQTINNLKLECVETTGIA